MIMPEIFKCTFIILMSAPLPILLLSSLFDYIRENMQNRYPEHKKHQQE